MPTNKSNNQQARAPRTGDFRERQRFENQVRETVSNSQDNASFDEFTWEMLDPTGIKSTSTGGIEDEIQNLRLLLETVRVETQRLEDAARKLEDIERTMSGLHPVPIQKLEDLVRRTNDNEILREMMVF